VYRAASHDHMPPSHTVVAQDRFMDTLRASAHDEFQHTARTIFTAAVASQPAPPGVSYRSVKHAIYSEKRENLLTTPQSCDDIEIAGDWGNTIRGDRFILLGPDKEMILFATDENIRMLARCQLWLMDGTFKCVPTLFAQLYTIHGEIGGYVVPLVFALLPNKQGTTYRGMFQRLFDYANFLGVQLCPTELVTDCELAIVQVVKDVLPTTVYRICFFHFVQANYRYVIENCGLAITYRDNREVQSLLRRFWALVIGGTQHMGHSPDTPIFPFLQNC